jgi:hypothetical protein
VQSAASDEGIKLGLLGEDQQVHDLVIGAECAGLLIAALAAELQKLDMRDKDQQFIRPTGMQTALTDKGEPMVLMDLGSGGELPLVFKVSSLHALISELQDLSQKLPQQSEVRWT